MTSVAHLRRRLCLAASLAALAALVAPAASADERKFPDVVEVKVRAQAGNRFDFDVTVSSPYDSAQRYADGFRVLSLDGKVLGERKLWHDHAGEQPFTRDLHDVPVPVGQRKVVVEARDQKHGWGGKRVEVSLPGR